MCYYHPFFNVRLTEDDVKMLPLLIQFYNRTNGGVDTMHKMGCQCTTARISRHWPLAVFFAMLDIGGVNAIIVSAEQR